MARYETTVTTPADPAQVFEYLADFSHAEDWDPGVASARKRTEGPIAVGTEFDVNVKIGPTTSRFTYRVTGFEPGRRIVLDAETPLLKSHDVISVDPEGDGSRVTYVADLTPTTLLFWTEPLLHLGFQRVGDRAAEGLKQKVTSLTTT